MSDPDTIFDPVLDPPFSSWFIVAVFVAAYGLAYLFRVGQTVACWWRWLRGDIDNGVSEQ